MLQLKKKMERALNLYFNYASIKKKMEKALNLYNKMFWERPHSHNFCYSLCDSWGRKESDTTEWLNWTELMVIIVLLLVIVNLLVRLVYKLKSIMVMYI